MSQDTTAPMVHSSRLTSTAESMPVASSPNSSSMPLDSCALARHARHAMTAEVSNAVAAAMDGTSAGEMSCSLVGGMVLLGISQKRQKSQTGIRKIPVYR